jgi:hypothetical protein
VADDRRRFRAIEVAWDADRAEIARLRELIARRSRPIAILLAATNPTADPVDTYGLTVADFAAVEAMRADVVSRLMPELDHARAIAAGWEAQAGHLPPETEQDWHGAEAARWLEGRAVDDVAEIPHLHEKVRYYAVVADGWADEGRRWLAAATHLGMDLTPFEHEAETVARLHRQVVRWKRIASRQATRRQQAEADLERERDEHL